MIARDRGGVGVTKKEAGMTRRRGLAVLALLALAATAFTTASTAGDDGGGKQIVIRDDCDPRDEAWNETGGCALRQGDVDFAEFIEEADSPLAAAVIGHQAWRNDPPYLELKEGQSVRVTNKGGRAHTLTEVAEWGGGVIPLLNEGLTPSPECAGMVVVPPGGSATISDLAPGNHRMICCIHPWMRALVKVHDRASH
jgi:plastocyanin